MHNHKIKLPFAATLLATVIASQAAQAGEYTVLESQHVTRSKAKPTVEVLEFSAPSSDAEYYIQVDNGPNGIKTAIGSVSLNGAEILNVKKKSTQLNQDVSLQLSNTVEVALQAAPQSGLNLKVIGIDNDAPIIDSAVDPDANAQGWHKQNANVSFTCADALSGIDTCNDDVVVDQEGAAQVIEGVAVDVAGNQSQTSVVINLDKSVPLLVPSLSEPANAAGWHNSDVTFSVACSDAFSGVLSCSEPQVLSSEGAEQLLVGRAEDNAGNQQQTELTISLDKTLPTVSGILSTQANASGWHNTDVMVTAQCQDSLSGIAQCSEPQLISVEALANKVVLSAIDIAGNSASSEMSVNLDKTKPTMSVTFSEQANSHGWYSAPIALTYSCEDGLSGVELCPETYDVSAEGIYDIQASAVDFAGNQTGISTAIKLDVSAPNLAFVLADNTLVTNTQPTLEILFSDNLSRDPSSIELSVNGSAVESSCELNEAGARCQLLSDLTSLDSVVGATASDLAGNQSQSSITLLLDADTDGVADSLDQCLNTEASADVNADGCSEDQLEPEVTEAEVVYENHYNALGQRVKQTHRDTTKQFVYGPSGELLAEIDEAGNTLKEYVYLPDGTPLVQIAQGDSGSDLHYVHTDHLGTPKLLTDESQEVVWQIETTAFGQQISEEGSAEQLQRFAGQYTDVESGLYYNYYRDYDPSLGRYIQSDPIGLNGGLNTYAYVGGNPISYIDPFGLEMLLQTHPVAAGQNHSKLTIIPNNQLRYMDDARFNNVLPDGRRFATIGAGPEGFLGERLVSNINRPRDLQMGNNQYSQSIFGQTCPSNDYEDSIIRQAFQLDSSYGDNLDYDFFPTSLFDGNNSNSYISGLLNALNTPMAQPPHTVGYQKPVPVNSF